MNDVLTAGTGTFSETDARKAVTSLHLCYKATSAYRQSLGQNG